MVRPGGGSVTASWGLVRRTTRRRGGSDAAGFLPMPTTARLCLIPLLLFATAAQDPYDLRCHWGTNRRNTRFQSSGTGLKTYDLLPDGPRAWPFIHMLCLLFPVEIE